MKNDDQFMQRRKEYVCTYANYGEKKYFLIYPIHSESPRSAVNFAVLISGQCISMHGMAS